jgi:anoctamin-10
MFGTITCVWSIVFVEWWKKQETDLSIRWHVQGVGALKVNRVQYNWEKEDTDAITGEVKKIFPAHKRLTRQLLFLPFAALAAFVLSIVLVVTFLIEAIISDVYGEELANYWVRNAMPYQQSCANDRSGFTLSSNDPSRCIAAIHHRLSDVYRYTTIRT